MSAQLCTSVYLWYFLMTLKENHFEKFCFSGIWNLQSVRWHVDTRWKVFSRIKSAYLTQPIKMNLSQNQQIFSEAFSAFPKFA